MANKLQKNIVLLETETGMKAQILSRGVTGGYYSSLTQPYVSHLSAKPRERNNASRCIVRFAEALSLEENNRYVLSGNFYLVFGAKVGGAHGRRAKQVEYALVKLY